MVLFDGLDNGPNIFSRIVPEADQSPSLSYLKQLLYTTDDPDEKQKIADQIRARGGQLNTEEAKLLNKAPGVDPKLYNILDKATDSLPDGWSARVQSGLREGDPRQHGKGNAVDIQLIKPDGSVVPNYQDANNFRSYEQVAQSARQVQQQLYPDLANAFRWGGYFSGPKGKYGAVDTMHFDLGGKDGLGMAGGNWETGLTDEQRKLFPGVVSAGMGQEPPQQRIQVASNDPNFVPSTSKASPKMADTPDNSSSGFGDKISGLFNDPMFMVGMQILSNSMVKRPLTAQISPFQGVPELLSAVQKTKLDQDKLRAQQLADAKAGNLLSLDIPSSPTAPTPAIPAPSAPVSPAGGLGGLGGIPASNIVPETPVGQMAPVAPLPPVRPDDLPTAGPGDSGVDPAAAPSSAPPAPPAPARVSATPVASPDVIQGPFGPKTSAWVQAKQRDALSIVGNSNNSDARRKQASDMLQMLSKYSDQGQQPTELKLWQAYKQNGGKLDFPTFLDRNQSEKDADKLQIHVTGQDPNTGAPVYSTFNPKTGEVKPLAAPAGTAPTDGRDPNLTGDDFLQTLPLDRRNQIKAMVEGRQPPISSFALSKPANKQLLADANQYDPTFDASNWASRSAANKEFHAGGPSSPAAQITAGNTAIQHLGHLVDLADKLNNGSFTPWNSVANSVSSAVGDNTAVKSFNTVRDLAAAEITKFYKGTVNKSDMEEVQRNISSSNTPAQLAETIKAQVDAMNAKINALQDRWHNAMGPNVKDFEIIQPESQAAIKKINAFADNGGKMPDEYRQGANPASAAKQTNTTQPSQKQPTVSGNVFGLKWGVSP